MPRGRLVGGCRPHLYPCPLLCALALLAPSIPPSPRAGWRKACMVAGPHSVAWAIARLSPPGDGAVRGKPSVIVSFVHHTYSVCVCSAIARRGARCNPPIVTTAVHVLVVHANIQRVVQVCPALHMFQATKEFPCRPTAVMSHGYGAAPAKTPPACNPPIRQSSNPSIPQAVYPSVLASSNLASRQSSNPASEQSGNPAILQSVNPSIRQSFNPPIPRLPARQSPLTPACIPD